MITFLLILISILVITQAVSIIAMMRAEKKISLYEQWIKEYEESVSLYETWISEFRERVNMAHDIMKNVDIRGAFEADDEVGNAYKVISQIVHDLNDAVSGKEPETPPEVPPLEPDQEGSNIMY